MCRVQLLDNVWSTAYIMCGAYSSLQIICGVLTDERYSLQIMCGVQITDNVWSTAYRCAECSLQIICGVQLTDERSAAYR